jgi:hypothetical protein
MGMPDLQVRPRFAILSQTLSDAATSRCTCYCALLQRQPGVHLCIVDDTTNFTCK